MRGGITCKDCNITLKSLKFFQSVDDQNRCPSCGFIGKIFAGKDKKLYLVESANKQTGTIPNLPEIKETSNKIENSGTTLITKREEKRERTVNRIIQLVDVMNIKEFSGWDDIDFRNISALKSQQEYLTEELVILLDNLERVYEKKAAGTIKKIKTAGSSPSTTMMDVPEILKASYDDWYRVSIGLLELFAKDLLKSARGRDKKELQDFIVFLSSLPKEKKADVFWNMNEQDEMVDEKSDMKTNIVDFIEDEVEVEDYFDESHLEKWRQLAPVRVKEEIPEWKTLSMQELQEEVLGLIAITKTISGRIELEDYVGVLDDLLLFNDNLDDNEAEDNATYDPLAVIEKYRHGAIAEDEKSSAFKVDESWRKMIPTSLKYYIKDWKTSSIESVYDQAKEIMGQSTGSTREELMPFVVELSQIIFDSIDEEEDDNEEEDDFSRDEVSEAVMNLVEMIILPHLEVMDIIQSRGGKITFSNLWYKPFTDKLKEEVKDRDDWKCIICEAETDLHVHHKIPREKGGIHHKDNLVTLCASCHAAVETADVQHAFKKCLANYNRKKFSHINRENLSMDKKLLREEVEGKLDALLHELNRRDEHTLMQEVVGIMKRLEIIFYD